MTKALRFILSGPLGKNRAFVGLHLLEPVGAGGDVLAAAILIPDRTKGKRLDFFQEGEPLRVVSITLQFA